MKDTVSIVIPVYNRQNVLEECVLSALAQSYTNFEILLVDDGSTDRSLEICKKLALSDSRIKLLESKHLGVSGARNIALENADGEFVFFLDSDDVIHPLLLESLVAGMKEYNCAMAGSGVINVRESNWHRVNAKIQEKTEFAEAEYHTNEEALHQIFRNNTPVNVIGGVMMRRSLIADTRFDSEFFIGEDFYFIYQNLIKNADVVFLKQKMYYCRLHENNISSHKGYEAFRTRFYRRVKVWESEENFGRIENAAILKREAFSIYLKSLTAYGLDKSEQKQAREVVKSYKKQILHAFSVKNKLGFLLYLYFPQLYRLRSKNKTV